MPINFRSKLHLKLLGYYFSNPNAEYYVRELARTLSFNGTYISRELRIFTRHGIFISSERNRQKYYRLNQKYPLYNEIKVIIKSIKSQPSFYLFVIFSPWRVNYVCSFLSYRHKIQKKIQNKDKKIVRKRGKRYK